MLPDKLSIGEKLHMQWLTSAWRRSKFLQRFVVRPHWSSGVSEGTNSARSSYAALTNIWFCNTTDGDAVANDSQDVAPLMQRDNVYKCV